MYEIHPREAVVRLEEEALREQRRLQQLLEDATSRLKDAKDALAATQSLASTARDAAKETPCRDLEGAVRDAMPGTSDKLLTQQVLHLQSLLEHAEQREQAAQQHLRQLEDSLLGVTGDESRAKGMNAYLIAKLRSSEAAADEMRERITSLEWSLRECDANLLETRKIAQQEAAAARDAKDRLAALLAQRGEVAALRDMLEQYLAGEEEDYDEEDEVLEDDNQVDGDGRSASMSNNAAAATASAVTEAVDESHTKPTDSGATFGLSPAEIERLVVHHDSQSPSPASSPRWHRREILR